MRNNTKAMNSFINKYIPKPPQPVTVLEIIDVPYTEEVEPMKRD